jgi:hypothetical protein
MASSFRHSFRKSWLKVLLVILVIAEASVFTGLEAIAWSHSYVYGSVQYGCKTLVGSRASNGSTVNITNVHWMVFGCPGGSAVTVAPGPFTCFFCAHEPPYATLIPNFTASPGVLGIFAIYDPIDECPGPNPTMPFNRSPLISGVSLIYSQSSLDYCVIVNASVKTISSFSLEWSTGPQTPPYTMPSVGFSAPSVSVNHGQNATFLLTLRSLHGFRGNVTFSLGGGLYAWLNPRSVLVKSGGSNSTTVTIETTGLSPGSYYVRPVADPVYGLQFYGDYSGSPLYQGNSTTIPISVT